MKTIFEKIQLLKAEIQSKGLEISMLVVGKNEAKELLEECKKWYPNVKNIHGWEYHGYIVLVCDKESYLGVVIGHNKYNNEIIM